MPKLSVDANRLRGYRIKLYPSEEQIELLQLNINSYRAIYNIGLDIQNRNYDNGNSYIKYFDMCKIFSDMRNNKIEFQWFKLIQLSTIRQALRDLDNAFKGFFNKIARYPKFKSRKRSKKFFTTRSDRTHSIDNYIKIPGIGLIEAKTNPIPKNARLFNTGVSFDGFDYWFYCQMEKDFVEIPANIINDNRSPIGVDVGIRNMITTSDGEYYHFSDTRKLEKRLKRQDRRLQKYYKKYLNISVHTKTKYEDIPKSKNMLKRLKDYFKTSSKIKHKKHNDIHNATKAIVEKFPSVIVIENISVTSQLKQRWIRTFAPSMMFYEIHRQLEYKAADRNIPIIVADREYPSSQICSNCGIRHNIGSRHIFKCPSCGLKIDRDLNAAYNLRNLAYL